jgi:hypothetical protein
VTTRDGAIRKRSRPGLPLLLLAIGLVTAAPTGRAQTPGATGRAPTPAPVKKSFDVVVTPVLKDLCSHCHNEKKANAGVNMSLLSSHESLASNRDTWERVLTMLRTKQMPPADEDPPPPGQLDALVTFVQSELDHADRTMKPDPGRVTNHRLNRAEYANTVRDLLGVDFRATDEFPADDSGFGFDNNGDVLTVSPALMEKYLVAAERIAARAVGGNPMPSPGVFTRRSSVRRPTENITEITEILNYDAEYVIRVILTGHRGETDPPVTLVISVDGKPIKTVSVPVQISAVNRQGGATQRGLQEARVFMDANEHTVRAEFVGDEALAKMPVRSRGDVNLNIFPEAVEIGGPYPPSPPTVARKKALICDPESGVACVNRILSTLSRRAYRRPVRAGEVARLVGVFQRARAAGYEPAPSLQFAIATMLVSPQFLFRIERDPGLGKIARITDVELASRLSYFLWSSMPDEALLRLGETNQLHLPAVLEAQVKRMLADPKAAALADNFAGQWLETRSLDAVRRDATKFPEWNRDLKEAMATETRLFFEAVVRENRPVTDFINGKFTFLNGLLAKHYGIPGIEGTQFRRVDLTTDERSGVFTQASVLTVSSYPTRTSVVLRGKYLLDNVLNLPPPPPPADVPALDEAAVGVGRSLRVQMEEHRSNPLCASCHTKMDPLGFALENYDAIGRWRTVDGKFAIDSSGVFPNGTSFRGPAQMKERLLESTPDFTRSLAEKMLTYALGRGVESYDRLVVRRIVEQTTRDGYRLQTLIQGVVKSMPFQYRRGEPAPVIALRQAQ